MLSFLFVENQVDCFVILWSFVIEVNSIPLKIPKIFLSFFIGGCSQSFVILYPPRFQVLYAFSPSLEITHCIERVSLPAFCSFQQRGNELLQESFHFEETRPKMMDEVNNKSFDVRSICVLV
jgi:hypothetical protein